MAMVTVQIGDDLAAILNQEQDEAPIERVARELIVLELYRRHTISSGRAAELLSVPRYDFIKRASSLGIPYIDMTEEEWEYEIRLVNTL
jgi:predicted HTH domain antitoxin